MRWCKLTMTPLRVFDVPMVVGSARYPRSCGMSSDKDGEESESSEKGGGGGAVRPDASPFSGRAWMVAGATCRGCRNHAELRGKLRTRRAGPEPAHLGAPRCAGSGPARRVLSFPRS